MASIASTSLPSLTGRPAVQLPVRYVILALVLLACSVEYVCRYNINVSMVAMVRPDNLTAEVQSEFSCPLPEARIVNGTIIRGTGTYDWDATTQGVILGGESYRRQSST